MIYDISEVITLFLASSTKGCIIYKHIDLSLTTGIVLINHKYVDHLGCNMGYYRFVLKPREVVWPYANTLIMTDRDGGDLAISAKFHCQ